MATLSVGITAATDIRPAARSASEGASRKTSSEARAEENKSFEISKPFPFVDIRQELGIDVHFPYWLDCHSLIGKVVDEKTVEIYIKNDDIAQKKITFNSNEELKKFQYLCSPVYQRHKKKLEAKRYKASIKKFQDDYINLSEFIPMVIKMTRNYFDAIFCDTTFLNMKKLVETSLPLFIKKLHDYHKKYHDRGDDWKDDEKLKLDFQYDMFSNNYLPFKKFTKWILNMTKLDDESEFPNGDCSDGIWEELNVRFNGELFAYMRKITTNYDKKDETETETLRSPSPLHSFPSSGLQ